MVRWLLLPLLALLVAHAFLRGGTFADVLVELGYDVGILLLVFGLFLFLAGRTANRAIRTATAHHRLVDEARVIRSRLETGQPPPLSAAFTGEVAVFVSGHTHAPSLTHFQGPAGHKGALVNSGCWLRQLQSLPAHLGAPPVFVSQFVQTHVRVYLDDGTIQVELWEHPRQSPRRLRVVERLAIDGRLPAQPDDDASPRVRERTSVERTSPVRLDDTTGSRP